MDEERKIRFLVAPILFVASVLWGAWWDHSARELMEQVLTDHTDHPDWSKVISLIAGGGFAVFVAGYVIGTLTTFFLGALFQIGHRVGFTKSQFQDISMSDGAFDIVWKRLEAPKEWARSQELFAGAAFAYDVLLKDHAGVHQWMFRRLTAFNIAATSICGLLLSFLFGHCVVGITWTLAWCFPVVVFAFILGVTAWVAWHDAMDMFDFMISLESAKEAGTGSAPRSAELAADRK